MNVLVISQYYLPQPLANAEVIGGLVEALGRRGWSVTVVSPVHDARPAPGVDHRRAFGWFARNRASIPARLLEYGTFSLGALVAGCAAPRPDVVVAPSPPLSLGVIGMLVAARHRAPFVYNVQDLYPEVASAVGGTPGVLQRAMQVLARFVYRRSARVVVIDPAFEPTIARSCPTAAVASVRNGIDMGPFEGAERDEAFLSSIGVPRARPVVMYAGNVGRSQDLQPVVDATRRCGATLVIHGGGARLDELEAWATETGADHVRFSGYAERDRLGSVFASADLHVVPLKPGVAWASVPSKMLSVFSAGRPAVVTAEPGSPAARILEEANGGWRVDPEAPDMLGDAIHSALQHTDELERRGRSARTWAAAFASNDRMAGEWSRLLTDVAAGCSTMSKPTGEPARRAV